MGRHLCRWLADSLSHGVPCKDGHRHWNRFRLSPVVAVSRRSSWCGDSKVLTQPSRNTSITYFPYNDDGQARFDFFKQVVAFHPIQSVLAVQEWNLSGINGGHFALALFTFLYVDIIDCTATLYSMARFCGVTDDRDGDFPRSTIAYCTDAACISIGSLLGCSPVTAFIESGAGIAEGGRTGLTAMTTGLCFLISIFFAPIFASIPPWATGCTLILVRQGVLASGRSEELDANIVKGRMPDDPSGDPGQLAIYRGRNSVLCRHDLHPVQLQRGLRAHSVSHQPQLYRRVGTPC